MEGTVTLLALYRERAGLLGKMLESAREQLACASAPAQDEGADVRLDAATQKRQGEMKAVDRLNADIAFVSKKPVPPQDQAAIDGLRADMNAALREMQATDDKTRAAIQASLSRTSAHMKASAQARKGIGAYMNMSQQIGSLYIDQQK